MRPSWRAVATAAILISCLLSCGVRAWAEDPAVTAVKMRDTFGERLKQRNFAEARAVIDKIRKLSTAAWTNDLEPLTAHLETAVGKLKAADFAAAKAALESAAALAGTTREVDAVWQLGFDLSDAAWKADAKSPARDALIVLHGGSGRPEVTEPQRMELLQRLIKAEQYALAEALLRENVAKLTNDGAAYIAWQAEAALFKRYLADGQNDKALNLLWAVRSGTPAKLYNESLRLQFLGGLNDLDAWPQLQTELQAILKAPDSTVSLKKFVRWALTVKLQRAAKTDAVAALKVVEQFLGGLNQEERELDLLGTWLSALAEAVKADNRIALGLDRIIRVDLLAQEASFADIRNTLELVRVLAEKAAKAEASAVAEPPADQGAAEFRLQLLAEIWRGRFLAEAEKYRTRAVEMKQRAEQEAAKGNTAGAAAYLKEEQDFLASEQRLKDRAERVGK